LSKNDKSYKTLVLSYDINYKGRLKVLPVRKGTSPFINIESNFGYLPPSPWEKGWG
jgi:hypothetical protein